MQSSLKNMVVVLLTITLVCSAAVGYVYKLTLDPIAKANAEKLSAGIKQVLPAFDSLDDVKELAVEGGEAFKVYVGRNGSEAVGYAVECYSNTGYAGQIKLLVGFTADGNINKVEVLSHAETPGLGAKITDYASHFVTQFEGKNPSSYTMKVKKDGGDVDAITASTISSRAYTLAIQNGYTELMKFIKDNQ